MLILFQTACGYPRTVDQLAQHINQPRLCEYIWRFLFDQSFPDLQVPGSHVQLYNCPAFSSSVSVFHSAVATYLPPATYLVSGECTVSASDQHQNGERKADVAIAFLWRQTHQPRVCVVFMHTRVQLLFSFKHNSHTYPCALVEWFTIHRDQPCEDTGMWIVEPEFDTQTHGRLMSVIHLDTIMRNAHLLPVYGSAFVPLAHFLDFTDSLDAFTAFYINKYASHHSHEIAS